MRRCGTPSNYTYGCRCPLCRDAHRQAQAESRERRRLRACGIDVEVPNRDPSVQYTQPIGAWHERAACKGKGALYLIPDSRGRYGRNVLTAANNEAINICYDCPVLEDCERWAIWQPFDPCPAHILAGLTPKQRRTKRRTVGIPTPGNPGGTAA